MATGKSRVAKGTARRKLSRRVEIQTANSRGVSWVDDGYREGAVEVWIDLDRVIALYGPDALGNKSGRARAMNGCVEIVAVKGSIQDHRIAAKES